MSPDAVFTPLRARMKAESWCIRILKADHSMQFGKDAEKERLMLNVAGQLAGLWLKTPPGGTGEWNVNDGTELDLSWNEKAQHPTWYLPSPLQFLFETPYHCSLHLDHNRNADYL